MTQNTTAIQVLAARPCLPQLLIPPLIRRRAMLNGSCAVSALLTLPAAVSVGVLLAGPVQAATTISGTNTGVSLSSYGTIDNPFTITSGTTVSATGNAIMGNDAGSWTLGNAGTVNGTDLGVLLQAGGSVTNDGSILGAMGRRTAFTWRPALPESPMAAPAGKGNWSLYANYNAYVSGNWTAQMGQAGLTVRF